MTPRYLLSFEFPIKEGYIAVEIKDDSDEVYSIPVAICAMDEEGTICESYDCKDCNQKHPEMIKRWENINKIYNEMKSTLESMARDMKYEVNKKLIEIKSEENRKLRIENLLNEPLPNKLPESCDRCRYFDQTYQFEPHCILNKSGVFNYNEKPPSWCKIRLKLEGKINDS